MLTLSTLAFGWDDDSVSTTNSSGTARRTGYHHGDLRNALTDAATELAKSGGPEAVVLREAARHVGVSATAAYRHFANHAELIHAVKERALLRLTESMEHELAEMTPTGDGRADAEARLVAVGRGYLRFALTEGGLFRIAFDQRDHELSKDESTLNDVAAYQLLAHAVDDLVECGVLPAERRPYTETVIWASVHGLAMLLLDGPLRQLPEDARLAAMARAGEVVLHGI